MRAPLFSKGRAHPAPVGGAPAARGYPLVDMFAGAGCASLGFQQAGFGVAAALELDGGRCDVYERNIGLRPVQRDAMGVTGAEMLKAAGLRGGAGFCMVGCPPCQSFSKLSDTRGVDAAADPRSRLVSKFGSLVAEMRPSAAVFENVAWMAGGPGRAFLDDYIEMLDGAGYRTVHGVVDASRAGVPQSRRRVIAVSVKRRILDRKGAILLDAFHGAGDRGGGRRTVRDALSGLPPLRRGHRSRTDPLHFASAHGSRVAEVIRHVPKNGGSRRDIPRRMWLECHKRLDGGAETSYGRMWWDRPSPTITRRCTSPACGRFIHPSQDRGITLREAARLQTIPDWYDFGGSSAAAIGGMIGDAVPVELAAWTARRLLAVLPPAR